MSGERRRVAIVQPSYIPWKGYFDLVNSVDHFVLLDDVQYTPRDWRNRNRVKTPGGARWLTVPVAAGGRPLISQVRVSDRSWPAEHWSVLRHSYARAPHWADYREELEALYGSCALARLVDVDERFIRAVCSWLGIATELSRASDWEVEGAKTDRLLALCRRLGATDYLSGPAARAYLDEEAFARDGIAVSWFSYEGYPEYPQLHGPFRHDVTALDLLLHTGPAARAHMLTFGARSGALTGILP